MRLGTAARWGARGLSALIILLWGVFLIAHAVGDAGQASRPLVWSDLLILATLVVSLGGLAMAWRWERAGALTAVVSLAACAAVNWKVLVFPGVLIPATALLFLVAWWLGRARRDKDAITPAV